MNKQVLRILEIQIINGCQSVLAYACCQCSLGLGTTGHYTYILPTRWEWSSHTVQGKEQVFLLHKWKGD